MTLIKDGGAAALEWGGTGEGTKASGLWTATDHSNGGQALPWYSSYKAFKDYFGPGTTIYKNTTTSSDFAILATADKTMLVNKTERKLSIQINQSINIELEPYQVKVVSTVSLPSGI